MSSDFETQMQSYAQEKKHKYEEQQRLNPTVHQDLNGSTESSLLVASRNNPNNFQLRNRFGCGCCSLLPDNSFKIGTIPILGGVALHIHMLWLLFIGLSCLGALQISFLFGVYSFLLGGPVLFLTVLIHELGHAAMAVSLGGHVDRVLLWPLGGLAYISFFGETSPKSDALVAIAGPLTHLPMVAAWCGLMALSSGGIVQLSWPLSWGYDLWLSVCAGAIGIQIALFLFNLVPAYPLDGGRLFGALLLHWGVDRNKSFQISACLGGVIMHPMQSSTELGALGLVPL